MKSDAINRKKKFEWQAAVTIRKHLSFSDARMAVEVEERKLLILGHSSSKNVIFHEGKLHFVSLI